MRGRSDGARLWLGEIVEDIPIVLRRLLPCEHPRDEAQPGRRGESWIGDAPAIARADAGKVSGEETEQVPAPRTSVQAGEGGPLGGRDPQPAR